MGSNTENNRAIYAIEHQRSSATAESVPLTVPRLCCDISKGPKAANKPLVNETEFLSFYNRTATALRSYLRMLCKDVAVADDLLQESYLRFLRARIMDMNEFQMKAYLYKAANSAVKNHRRARIREHGRRESPVESQGTWDPNLVHDMMQLFKKLKAQQQTLLWLAYVEGFQHREIAKVLCLREKSIRVLLLRARKELAGIFSAKGIGKRKKS